MVDKQRIQQYREVMEPLIHDDKCTETYDAMFERIVENKLDHLFETLDSAKYCLIDYFIPNTITYRCNFFAYLSTQYLAYSIIDIIDASGIRKCLKEELAIDGLKDYGLKVEGTGTGIPSRVALRMMLEQPELFFPIFRVIISYQMGINKQLTEEFYNYWIITLKSVQNNPNPTRQMIDLTESVSGSTQIIDMIERASGAKQLIRLLESEKFPPHTIPHDNKST